jgi:hypothetical protein
MTVTGINNAVVKLKDRYNRRVTFLVMFEIVQHKGLPRDNLIEIAISAESFAEFISRKMYYHF